MDFSQLLNQLPNADSDSLVLVVLLLASFFLGAIPTGYLVGKLYGIDIRKHGSKNIGATNIHRTLGKTAGAITFVLDLAKGYLSTLLPFLATTQYLDNATLSAACGFSAIIGHCFSPFLNLKGGKGVATSCGVFFALTPRLTVIALIVFAAVVKISRYVSLGSILSALSVPILLWFVWPDGYHESTKLGATAAAAVIIIRHAGNVRRLLNGEERRI